MRGIGVGGVSRMALGRKKSGGRKEPLFGLPAALADLRLSAADRIPGGEDKPKKSSAKRPSKDGDDGAPRERKPAASRSGSVTSATRPIGASCWAACWTPTVR